MYLFYCQVRTGALAVLTSLLDGTRQYLQAAEDRYSHSHAASNDEICYQRSALCLSVIGALAPVIVVTVEVRTYLDKRMETSLRTYLDKRMEGAQRGLTNFHLKRPGLVRC